MKLRDVDWEDLKAFKEVAASRTVRGAAVRLGVHHSTVSRRIETLEDSLGARLFDRRPDGYALTSAGEELAALAQTFAEDLLAVRRQIAGKDAALSGSLTVTMSEAIATHAFAPRLSEFAGAYPNLELRFITTSSFLDVARREADVAIRMDNNPPDMLVGKRLFPYFQTVYASPTYLAAQDFAAAPERARWLRWNGSDDRFPAWTQATEFARTPAWGHFPEIGLQQAAARAGLGLALLPCLIGDRDPGLVRATTRPPIQARDIWILTHRDLRRTARIRAFMDFAERVLRDLKGAIAGDRLLPQ